MNDNPESTGVQEQNGTPAPNASNTDPVSPTSGSKVDYEKLVEGIINHPSFQKQTQSVKDKRIAEMQKTQEQLSAETASLARHLGVDPTKLAQAQQQVEYEKNMEWISKQRQQQVPSQTSPGSGVDLAAIRKTVLEATGLSETATGIDEYMAQLDWGNDPYKATTQLTAWASAKKAGIPTPTAATTAPPSGGVTPPSPNVEALTKQFEQLLDEPMSKENLAKRDEVLKRLNELEGRT